MDVHSDIGETDKQWIGNLFSTHIHDVSLV